MNFAHTSYVNSENDKIGIIIWNLLKNIIFIVINGGVLIYNV